MREITDENEMLSLLKMAVKVEIFSNSILITLIDGATIDINFEPGTDSLYIDLDDTP